MRRLKAIAARIGAAAMIGVIRALFAFLRMLGPERASDLGGWLLRTASPLIPVNRVALANIRAAFPEKDEAEVRRIARGALPKRTRRTMRMPREMTARRGPSWRSARMPISASPVR